MKNALALAALLTFTFASAAAQPEYLRHARAARRRLRAPALRDTALGAACGRAQPG